jgi:hypothetical protein
MENNEKLLETLKIENKFLEALTKTQNKKISDLVLENSIQEVKLTDLADLVQELINENNTLKAKISSLEYENNLKEMNKENQVLENELEPQEKSKNPFKRK